MNIIELLSFYLRRKAVQYNDSLNPLNENLPSAWNFKCEGNANVNTYSGECDGERVHSISTAYLNFMKVLCTYDNKLNS